MLALMGPVPAWMIDDDPSPPRHKVCQENVPPNLQGHLSPARYDDFAEEVDTMVEFRSASHVYSPKKSHYATRQLYHFVRPGWRRIAATTEAPGLTLSAFQGPSPDALVIVGVKEGGPSRFRIDMPQTGTGPASWDLYETTRELDC